MRLLVIGGGPAGVSAALQGAELGASVTLVESKRVGGTSINEGPAPITSKRMNNSPGVGTAVAARGESDPRPIDPPLSRPRRHRCHRIG